MKRHLRLILLLLVLGLVALYAWRKMPRKPYGISAVGGTAASIQLAEIPFYFQTDPRWARQQIGGSGEKLESVGCTIASVSMGLAHFGIDLAPDKLNAGLKARGGYTERGWLIWHKIGELTGGKVAVLVPEKFTHETIDTALAKGQPVVANVTMGDFLHWVLITGKNGQEYLIHDPLGKPVNEKLSKFDSPIYAIRILAKS